jgi:ubiquitin carboxyl-terminal hydrolase 36/42
MSCQNVHTCCFMRGNMAPLTLITTFLSSIVWVPSIMLHCVYSIRCSPRAPSFVRKAMVTQGVSHAKNHRQLADSRPISLGGSSYLSRHQGGQLCEDNTVHDLTHTLDTSGGSSHQAPEFSRSDNYSLFSSSDAVSTSTLSTDSTMNSTSMEYDYIFVGSDQMCPVNTEVLPEDQELSYSRQWSSLSSSSSGQNMDQTGEFVQQNRAGGRVCEESGGNTSFSYTGQGKNQDSSSSSSSRHTRSCKLTELHGMTGVADHGPGRDGVLHRRPTRERTAQTFLTKD